MSFLVERNIPELVSERKFKLVFCKCQDIPATIYNYYKLETSSTIVVITTIKKIAELEHFQKNIKNAIDRMHKLESQQPYSYAIFITVGDKYPSYSTLSKHILLKKFMTCMTCMTCIT